LPPPFDPRPVIAAERNISKTDVWGLGASPPFKISNKAKPEKHAKEQELFAP